MATTQHTTTIIRKYEDVSIDELIAKLQDLKEDLQSLDATNSYINIDFAYDVDGECDVNLVCTYHIQETAKEKELREDRQKQLMEEIQKQRRTIQLQELKDKFMNGEISASEYETKSKRFK